MKKILEIQDCMMQPNITDKNEVQKRKFDHESQNKIENGTN